MMKTLEFKTRIAASPEKVWQTLWNDDTFREWTRPFHDGSHYKTDGFVEGNKIHFLTPEGQGMVSLFHKIEPNKYLAFRHIGSVDNFEEVPPDEASESWMNAMETYRLTPVDDGTELLVTVDVVEEYLDMMRSMFPAALEALKSLSEGSSN